MAIKREVTATWKPSLSADVKAQKLQWYTNGRLVKRVVLRARENARSWGTDNPNLPVLEGDTIQCRICAVDEVGESDWIQAEVAYPYVKPDPPTELNLNKLPLYLNVL